MTKKEKLLQEVKKMATREETSDMNETESNDTKSNLTVNDTVAEEVGTAEDTVVKQDGKTADKAEDKKEHKEMGTTTSETADFEINIKLTEESSTDRKQTAGEMQFSSTSQEIRKRIEELLKNGESYSKKLITEHLNMTVTGGYSEACLINVLRNMVADGSLMQIERGSYMQGTGYFRSRLYKYMSATRSGMKKACTLNASEMEEADFEIIVHIKAIEKNMDLLMEVLERAGA
ncbi:MAG: hypothetical protein K0S76_754 [Herbinix sp.]|nr:hypothetical protein [Herbinix sp.]